jgi:Cu/Ag efflux pump CusA
MKRSALLRLQPSARSIADSEVRTFYVSSISSTCPLAGFVSEAGRVVGEKVKLPPGYPIDWGGKFEQLEVPHAA